MYAPLGAILLDHVCVHFCKGAHSLMPNLGRVVDSDGLVDLRSGFHQWYKQTRWGERIGLRWNEPRRNNLVGIEEQLETWCSHKYTTYTFC